MRGRVSVVRTRPLVNSTPGPRISGHRSKSRSATLASVVLADAFPRCGASAAIVLIFSSQICCPLAWQIDDHAASNRVCYSLPREAGNLFGRSRYGVGKLITAAAVGRHSQQ